MRFTSDRREQFLELLEHGHNQEEACAQVGISRTSVNNWVTRGRLPGASAEAAEFAERFDAIRECSRLGPGLSEEDLIRLLERQARKGSVNAIAKLLERPWEKKRGKQDDDDQQQDQFAALDAGAPVVDLASRRDRGA